MHSHALRFFTAPPPPQVGTLSCLYRSPACYFVTGVGGPFIEDSLYAIDRDTGATLFKHTLPPGVYLDNVVLDWVADELYSVANDPFNRRTSINKVRTHAAAHGAPPPQRLALTALRRALPQRTCGARPPQHIHRAAPHPRQWNSSTGAFQSEFDISRDVEGRVYAGAVTLCPSTKMLYVGEWGSYVAARAPLLAL